MADPCSSSSMAGSASTSSSQNFQVFINHRGPDTKDTIATPLYRSLTQSGLLVFLDKSEMQLGHDIPSQIKEAIQVASLHVAILSPRYAESDWCLNELLLMIESKKTIIPVFYNVKPSDLRWTGEEKNGPYARALYAHEKKKRYDPQTIQRWRTALSHVANISGLELEAFNGEEEKLQRQEELLGKVVQSVLKIVPPPLHVAEYPTGLGGKLEEFESTVLSEHQREHRVGAKVVGIVGLGGIGKTTLARYFFNLKRSEYNMSSILFDVKDVRENAAKISLNSLQRELIKELKNRDIQIKKWEEGKEILKKNLSFSDHALIIVDDVDHIDQLDAFLPIKDVLHPNSLILVTSRDKGVLRRAKIVESSIYHLRGLTRADSQQLFCCYAFSQQVPKPGFKNFVEGFIEACHGLPLSLKVLGALLYGEDEHSYWKGLLDGLNKLLPDDIEKSLRISYESLNEEEKQIFLDITCFCIGDDRDKWIRIWEGSGWTSFVGFRNLQNKCLVDVDHENKIRMHDHLRDMGRNVADSSRSMPRRLWQPIYNLKDINDLLEESSPVITEVRGFRISMYFERHNQSRNHSRSHEVLVMRKLQLLEAEGDFVESILTRVESPKLIWLNWHDCPYPSLPSRISMHDLRVLEVHGYFLKKLWASERQAPLQLRELYITAPLEEFPKSLVQLKHLEKIVAWHLELATFPQEFNLPSLNHLELHYCKFQRLWQREYGAPLQLRTLIVDAPLVEFPKSLWQLEHLEKIVASNTSLEMFPTEFNMPSLKYLELRGCKFRRLWQSEYGSWELIIDAPLGEFPKSLEQLQHLEKIVARNTSLEMFPEEFNMPSLKYLELRGCKFQRLWQSEYGAPLQLRELISDAPLVEFPKSLGQLQHLEKIVATNTSLEMFPKEFNVPSLKYLELSGCKLQRLWQSEYEAPLQLRELIIDAPLVEFPKSLGQLQHLEKIVATNTSLEMFPKEFNMPSLKYLLLRGCKFQRLWQSEHGAPLQLRELIIDAPLVEFPKSLGQLQHLYNIVATDTSLEIFPQEFNLPSLKHLELHCCKFQRLWQCEYGAPLQLRELIIDAPLVEFPKSLGHLQHLEKIVARNTSLEMFPKEFNMPSLKCLELRGCKVQRLWQSEYESWELIIDAPLVEFPKSLEHLQHLEKIVARNTSLEMFPKEFNMPSLKYLELRGCKFQSLWQSEYGAPLQLRELISDAPLVEFPKSLGQLQHLEKIVATNTSLEIFPKEFNVPSLKYLELSDRKVQRLWQSEYEAPLQLRELIIDAPLVEFPKSLGQLQHLEKIVVTNMSLEMFPEEFNMPSLKFLELRRCKFQRLWQSEYGAPLQLRELIIDAPLVEFPKSLGQLQHLEKIVATNTSLEMFPKDNMTSLKYLELRGCKFQRLWQSEYGAPLQLRELIIDAPLVEFPKSLGQLQHLKKIVATNTSLEMFPKEFNMTSLKYLQLQGCKFQRLWQSEYGAPRQLRELIIDAPLVEFPKSMGQLQHLEKIVATNTSLEMFPKEFNMPSLEYLELSGCKFQRLWQCEYGAPLLLRTLIIDAPLVEFPMSMGLLHLEKIVARNTSLEMFPKEFNMTSLKYLELRRCKFQWLWQSEYGAPLQLRELIIDAPLVEFPKSMGQLQHLEKIVAMNTSLEMFPKEFNMHSLKYLELSGCKFQRLWRCEYGAPLQLRELIIDAPLVEFPKSLGHLDHLEKIVARNTSLEMFPKEFNLPSLKYLELSGCKFQRLWQCEYGAPLQLRELIIDALLVEFPMSLGQLKHLERVVAKTSQASLPDFFGNLTNLRCIDLSFCKRLEILPNSFQHLLQLEHLHLKGCCSLTISSETLGNFTELECLDLSGCLHMELLPPQIAGQQSLVKLNLLGTILKELPCDLVSLSNLKVLRVGSPSLEVLPPSVGCLRNLKQLWLHECEKLQCLPDSVELLSQLTELKIWKCGIQYLPPAVMKMSNLKVLAVCRCPLRKLPFCPSIELQSQELPLDSSINEGMIQLRELQLYRTEVLEVSFPERVCPNLQDLRIVRCEHLVEVGALPTPLRNLDLGYCGELRKIKGIYGVTKLEKLDMRGCNNIEVEELQGLGTLISSGLKLLRFQTEHFEDDSSIEQNVFSEPFCSSCTPLDTEDSGKAARQALEENTAGKAVLLDLNQSC